ncbi:MAG: glycosyltransferase family protein [Magnetococcales bacterium]|nr:glycosyltransferase family protein [Magnetococcales bacterium]
MSDEQIAQLWQQAVHAFETGDPGTAVRSGAKILTLDPNHADALDLLGMCAKLTGDASRAIGFMGKAVSLQPDNPVFQHHLGVTLMETGQTAAALERIQDAVRLKPDFAEAHVNLGNILFQSGDPGGAARSYQTAVQLDPTQATAFYNLGILFQKFRKHDTAIPFFDQALSSRPDYVDAHMGRAFSQLMTGNFEQGWEAYEWRLKMPFMPVREAQVPRWDGAPSEPKRLHIFAEQGFGDAIQFARYLPMVRQRGHHILFECRPELAPLIRSSDLADEIILKSTDAPPPSPECDANVPLLSLPRLFKTRLDSIPASVPYLRADTARIDYWRLRLSAYEGARIGLVWSGDPTSSANIGRCCTFSDLAPLLETPGATFFSLQKGTPAREMHAHPAASRVIDLDSELTDFGETAALMMNLDLLISTDTAVVHLMGALGQAAWTMTFTESEWRWLEGRNDSPWYPTMRLYRQNTPQRWDDVVQRIQGDLTEFLAR